MNIRISRLLGGRAEAPPRGGSQHSPRWLRPAPLRTGFYYFAFRRKQYPRTNRKTRLLAGRHPDCVVKNRHPKEFISSLPLTFPNLCFPSGAARTIGATPAAAPEGFFHPTPKSPKNRIPRDLFIRSRGILSQIAAAPPLSSSSLSGSQSLRPLGFSSLSTSGRSAFPAAQPFRPLCSRPSLIQGRTSAASSATSDADAEWLSP